MFLRFMRHSPQLARIRFMKKYTTKKNDLDAPLNGAALHLLLISLLSPMTVAPDVIVRARVSDAASAATVLVASHTFHVDFPRL